MNIDSVNGLLTSSNKQLPESKLTKIDDIIWHYYAAMS